MRQRLVPLLLGVVVLGMVLALVWTVTGGGDEAESLALPRESRGTPPLAVEPEIDAAAGSSVSREEARVDGSSIPGERDRAARTGTLHLRVLWAEDRLPVPDLRVRILAGRALNWWVRTDAEGRATVPDVPAGEVSLHTVLGGWQDAEVPAGAEAEVEVTLATGLVVEGEVVDDRGAPIAGAGLWLGPDGSSTVGEVVATTARDGRFRLRCVETSVVLGAHAKGFEPSLRQFFDGAPGEVRAAHFQLRGPGGSLQGLVLDHEGGPVPDAWVLIGEGRVRTEIMADGVRANRPNATYRETDAEGRFQVDSLALGDTPVAVRVEGHALTSTSVEVTDQRVAQLVVQLEPEARVFGTVTDGAGAPVAGASVRRVLRDEAALPYFFNLFTRSDGDGRYSLAGLPAGEVLLEVSKRGEDTVREALVLVTGERRRWDPVLRRRPRIHGQLVDELGAGIAGWVVVAASDFHDGLQSLGGVATTGEDGRFVVGSLEDLPYRLSAAPPARRRLPDVATWEGVRPGAEWQVFRVPVHDLPEARAVGRLLDPQDPSVVGARLLVRSSEREGLWTAPIDAASGHFEFGPAPPGLYSFAIDFEHGGRPDYFLGDVELVHDRVHDFGAITLPRTGRLVVEVLGEDPEVPMAPELTVYQEGRWIAGLTREEQGFVSPPLFAGAYDLRVTGAVLRQEHRFEIQADLDTRRSVRVRAAVIQEFVLVAAADADPPGHLDVEVRGEDGEVVEAPGDLDLPRLRRDLERERATGLRRLTWLSFSLLPGSYVLQVTSDVGLSAEVRFSVDFGSETAEREVVLRR